MMSPTHAATGIAIATPLIPFAPELAGPAALGGLAGGIFPDLDLFVGDHRRTLHFPAGYTLAGLVATGIALAIGTGAAAAVAAFLLSAGIHSVADMFGAGDELRPWERTEERAVYFHLGGRWLHARRWIRYDGAPEDLAATVVLSLPGLILFDEPVRTASAVLVLSGVLYAVIRKRVPDYWERFVR